MPYYTRAMVLYLRKQRKLNEQDGGSSAKKVSPEESANKVVGKASSSTTSLAKNRGGGGGGGSAGGSAGSTTDSTISAADQKKATPKTRGTGLAEARMLRVTPSCVDDDPTTGVSDFDADKDHPNNMKVHFDANQLSSMKNLVRLEVERIHRFDAAIPRTSTSFEKYVVETKPLRRTTKCTMFNAHYTEYDDAIICRLYKHMDLAVPNPIFLKLLRRLGTKHPYILGTWEIFVDQEKCIYLIQEYANRHDLSSYLGKTKPLEESQVCEWARQLHKAMDFLSDIGICHRAIKPKHIFLKHRQLFIKLTGFYEAVIYWNVKTDDIANIPCIPLAEKNRQVPDFQAPEVHGRADLEEFDPILADVWSYAAVVYFASTQGMYPYDFRKDNPRVESEIQSNVAKVNLSEEGKNFLSQLLNTNALARLPFYQIHHQAWFGKFRKDNVVSSQKLV